MLTIASKTASNASLLIPPSPSHHRPNSLRSLKRAPQLRRSPDVPKAKSESKAHAVALGLKAKNSKILALILRLALALALFLALILAPMPNMSFFTKYGK